ncbi:MAG: ATP-dependent Clp protease adaptor ClpS [Saprospiraceae bacterium]
MNKANFSPDQGENVMTLESTSTENLSQLVVYNDDYNTFDWVIQCFIEVCNHTFEQSEQLSLIIHYKGKAIAKTDSFLELTPLKDALIERGLSAVIETLKESN